MLAFYKLELASETGTMCHVGRMHVQYKHRYKTNKSQRHRNIRQKQGQKIKCMGGMEEKQTWSKPNQ